MTVYPCRMDISVIIPVFNEEDGICLIYRTLKKVFLNLHKQYELIFINDGSSDNSLAVLKSILQIDSCIKVISFDGNYGQTSALDAGFKHANGEIILTIDADSQYDSQDLLRILEELISDDVDAVLGKRVNRTSGLIKNICSKIAIFIRNSVLNESYQDSSLAGYKKECLKGLILYKDSQVFIPTFLKIQGFRIKEINVKEHPRRCGQSKYNLKNRLLKSFFALFAIKWLKDNQLKYKISEVLK